ncbi:MAG TPA: hypothetical protein VKF28_03190 [Candidatus Dormibacteraeota bacterium]|nr:hypothetical protein [Candidatus Dormibacteraeota bacterium]
MSTVVFDAGRRAVLAAVGDVLIPNADGMPSASEAGVAMRWLDEVLRLRPDFGPPLAAVLDRIKGADLAAAVERLRAEDPAGFGVLAEVVAGGYFLNPQVRSAIGYAGQESVPIEHEEPADYERDGLIASVIARGPVYRPTP